MRDSYAERNFCQYRIQTDNGPICGEGDPCYYDPCPHTIEEIRPDRTTGDLRIPGCPPFEAAIGLESHLVQLQVIKV